MQSFQVSMEIANNGFSGLMYSEAQQKIYVADAVTSREAEKQECNLLGLVSTHTHFPESRKCVQGEESDVSYYQL